MSNEIISSGSIMDTNTGNSSGSLYLNRATVITGNQYVVDGDIVSNITISSGNQYVSGGTAVSTTITGNQSVFSGNVVATIINGSQFVAGGNVTNTSITSGSQQILEGTIISTNIAIGSQTISGGIVSDTYIDRGAQVIDSGIASNTSINSGYQDIGSGIVSNTSINSGYQIIFGGSIFNTHIVSGSQRVVGGAIHSGRVLISNTIIDNGFQELQFGDAFYTSIASGSQYVDLAGVASYTTINSGSQILNAGGIAHYTSIVTGSQDVSTGSAYDTIIDNGFQIVRGLLPSWIGSAYNTIISNGSQTVLSGGFVYNTSIVTGSQIISDGTVYDTTINSGAQIVSGGVISGTTYLHQNASQVVMSGVILSNVLISAGAANDGGMQVILSSAVVNDTTLNQISQVVLSGGSANNNVINSASQIISEGNVTNTIMSNGNQYVSGGIVSNTSVNVGSQIVLNGTVHDTTVDNGEQIVSGGTVTNTTLNVGSQVIYGGTVYDTSVNSGAQIIYGGVISGVTSLDRYASQIVMSGVHLSNLVISGISYAAGKQIISSGGAVYDNTLHGVTQIISSGAIASGTILDADFSVSSGNSFSYSGDGASQFVLGGGSAYGTIIWVGSQVVSSGAVAYNTSILGSGQGIIQTSQIILSGGIASNTFISGGYQIVGSGATVNDTTVTDGAIYADDGSNLGNMVINSGGWLNVGLGTNIQGEVTLNPGGSALITTSNGGVINLVGDTNGGLTIIGEPPLINWEGNNASVTTQIQGFNGEDPNNSDGILLQYEDIESGKLSNVTFPDNDHITITMDTGFSLTLNIVGIKQTGYSIRSPADGESGLLLTVCFLSGTEIRTKTGFQKIEHLQTGDFVKTYDWKKKKYTERAITWIGKRYCRVNKYLPDDMAGYPVRILKDAIAKNIPYKDLLVTSEHCLFFKDKFIPVRMLVNGSTIFYDYSITMYDYYHIEVDGHSIIIADGVLTESYLDTGNRHIFNHHQKVVETSLQSKKTWETDAVAPLSVAREEVEPIYNQLQKRSRIIKAGYKGKNVIKIEDPDIHLITDQGQIIRQKHITDDRVIFMVPSSAEYIWIKSRKSRPSDAIGPFVDDRRFLGVLIGDIKIYADQHVETINVHKETKDLVGWHSIEQSQSRWTAGKALLPLKKGYDNSVIYVSLQIVVSGPYVEVGTEENNEILLVG